MKNIVIVGHRGTGKTTLLNRIKGYWGSQWITVDLDREIEIRTGRTIDEIFANSGEAEFRRLEVQTFSEISGGSFRVIAVGGGFPIDKIPESFLVLWLRRDSDALGRIFLDRPSLVNDLDPLEEFELKRQQREAKFSNRANFVYTMPEGMHLGSKFGELIEKQILSFQSDPVGGLRTLFQVDLPRTLEPMPDLFEVRDDLLSTQEVEAVLAKYNSENVLYTLRISRSIPEKIRSSKCLVDIPVELGIEIGDISHNRVVYSSHLDSICEAIQELGKTTLVTHKKLSPLVETWEDLEEGHRWQQQDPSFRSFLPRSKEGRWSWYRLYQKGRQRINFWRDGMGSAVDQPTLFQWLLHPQRVDQFAAVVGRPIQHSLSPMFHADFFLKGKCPFYGISVSEAEWPKALRFLTGLGLRFAAVTSPLKKLTCSLCEPHGDAEIYSAVNTLIYKNHKWMGQNTDGVGFRAAIRKIDWQVPAVLWGGGGVVDMVSASVPAVVPYSSRTGRPRMKLNEPILPKTLFWAAPQFLHARYPPEEWRPEWVIDLNYAENSHGRLYAKRIGAHYLSGLDFFRYQALDQQRFWSEYNGG